MDSARLINFTILSISLGIPGKLGEVAINESQAAWAGTIKSGGFFS